MLARHNACRSDNIAMRIGDRQDVAGLGAFTSLISHTLAALLGDGMRAIQVHLLQVQLWCNAHNAVLPHALQTAVSAPSAPMVIDGLPAWFAFPLTFRSVLRDWQAIPLAARVQAVHDQVEYPHQRRFATFALLPPTCACSATTPRSALMPLGS